MKRKALLSVLLVCLIIVSCGKGDFDNTEEPLEPHPTWTDDSTNNFWE